MSVFIEGNWFEVVTIGGTKYNTKADNAEHAIDIVLNRTGLSKVLDVYQPSTLRGIII